MQLPSRPRGPACASGLRASKKERTRRALCDAAVELALDGGYDAATVEAIAHRADVSVRTFHNYFPGKAALFATLATDLLGDYAESFGAQPAELSCTEAMRDAWIDLMRSGDELQLDRLGMVLDAMRAEPEIMTNLVETAPEAIAPMRAQIAGRLGGDVDPERSVITWFGCELALMAAGYVLRGTELGLDHADDPETLLAEIFDGLGSLSRR